MTPRDILAASTALVLMTAAPVRAASPTLIQPGVDRGNPALWTLEFPGAGSMLAPFATMIPSTGVMQLLPGVIPFGTTSGTVARGDVDPLARGALQAAGGTVTGALNFAPPANSLAKALTINQSVAGSVANGSPNQSYWGNYVLTNGDQVDAQGTGGGFYSPFAVFHNYGGGAMTGGRNTFAVYSVMTGPSASNNTNHNWNGALFDTHCQANDGGTDPVTGPKGACFGMNPQAVLDPNATNMLEVTSAEANVIMKAGSSAKYKAGLTIVWGGGDVVQGSVYDTLLALSAQSGDVGSQDGILIGAMNGTFPLTSTGTAFRTINGSFKTGIDLSTSTLSNALMTGPGGFVIAPNGTVYTASYKLGGDANGRLALGTANTSGTPYLQFLGNGLASGYSVQMMATALDTLTISSSAKTLAAFSDAGLNLEALTLSNASALSFSGSGSYRIDGSGADTLRLTGGGTSGGMIIYGNAGAGTDGTIRFRNNSADSSTGANLDAGSGALRLLGNSVSTSTTTGEFVNSGGEGIAGDLWVGGTVHFGAYTGTSSVTPTGYISITDSSGTVRHLAVIP